MRTLLLCAALAPLAAPAIAKEHNAQPKDPNKVICKTEDVIGSRLQTKKTCLTAQQWEDMNRETRQTVDRVQNYKPNMGN